MIVEIQCPDCPNVGEEELTNIAQRVARRLLGARSSGTRIYDAPESMTDIEQVVDLVASQFNLCGDDLQIIPA